MKLENLSKDELICLLRSRFYRIEERDLVEAKIDSLTKKAEMLSDQAKKDMKKYSDKGKKLTGIALVENRVEWHKASERFDKAMKMYDKIDKLYESIGIGTGTKK